MSIKFVPGLAKTRAIPSLYRDYFLAKEPGQQPVLASGNAYYHNRRAVSCKARVRQARTIPGLANAQARVLQPTPAIIPALQNTCFSHRSH